jgi:hypothetical protein
MLQSLNTNTVYSLSFHNDTIQHILLMLKAVPSGLNHLMQPLAVQHFIKFNINDT